MKTLFTWIICLLPIISLAKDDDIKFSGSGETGIKFTQQNIVKGYPEETYFKAKLQADIKLNKNMDAKIEFKGDSSDKHVSFHEFSIKFDYTDYFKSKVGYLKLPISYEQQLSRTKILTFNRSNAQYRMSQMGYGGRSFSILGYYNFNKKRPLFPYSYAINLSKDNSNNASINLMGRRHFNDLFVSTYFQSLNRKGVGELNISTMGFGSDIVYQSSNSTLAFMVFLLEDPIIGLQHIEQNLLIQNNQLDTPLLDESIITGAINSFAAYRFNTNKDVIKTIEPIILTSVFYESIDQLNDSELQTAFGLNAYFSKDVRLRFQFDLLFSKKPSSEESGFNGSSVELGIQVKF